MPVVRKPVDTRVLTHRRDENPAGEGQRAKRQRFEEVRHRDRLSLETQGAPERSVTIDAHARHKRSPRRTSEVAGGLSASGLEWASAWRAPSGRRGTAGRGVP